MDYTRDPSAGNTPTAESVVAVVADVAERNGFIRICVEWAIHGCATLLTCAFIVSQMDFIGLLFIYSLRIQGYDGERW